MQRSHRTHRTVFFVLLALLAAPAWPETQTKGNSGSGLPPGYGVTATAPVPAVAPPAAPDAGLPLKLARELRGARAPAKQVMSLSPTLAGMLLAVLLFVAGNTVLLLLFSM